MTQVVEYNIETAVIESLKSKYDIQEIKNGRDYAFVMAGLAEYRELRLRIDERHKELKKDALEYGRAVDTEKNRLKGLLEPGEVHLKAVRQAEDDRKSTIKAEKERIERERVDKIRMSISSIQQLVRIDLTMSSEEIEKRLSELENFQITEEVFQELTTEAQTVFDETFANIQIALISRIEWEKEEKARQAVTERLEKIQLEQEIERQKIDEEKRIIQEEKDWIEAEKKAEKERKDRADFEQKAREEAELKIRNAHIYAEIARIAKEKAEAEEKAHQEALKPDKEKLLLFADVLEKLVVPKVKDPKAIAIRTEINDSLDHIVAMIREEVEGL